MSIHILIERVSSDHPVGKLLDSLRMEINYIGVFWRFRSPYRIAVGPHQGRKVFTLQTLPPLVGGEGLGQAAKVAGFSLHAGVVAEPHRRVKLERLCRYVSRPAVSEKRMALTPKPKPFECVFRGITNVRPGGIDVFDQPG